MLTTINPARDMTFDIRTTYVRMIALMPHSTLFLFSYCIMSMSQNETDLLMFSIKFYNFWITSHQQKILVSLLHDQGITIYYVRTSAHGLWKIFTQRYQVPYPTELRTVGTRYKKEFHLSCDARDIWRQINWCWKVIRTKTRMLI